MGSVEGLSVERLGGWTLVRRTAGFLLTIRPWGLEPRTAGVYRRVALGEEAQGVQAGGSLNATKVITITVFASPDAGSAIDEETYARHSVHQLPEAKVPLLAGTWS